MRITPVLGRIVVDGVGQLLSFVNGLERGLRAVMPNRRLAVAVIVRPGDMRRRAINVLKA